MSKISSLLCYLNTMAIGEGDGDEREYLRHIPEWLELEQEIAKLQHDSAMWQSFLRRSPPANSVQLLENAQRLILDATAANHVVRIETRPLLPLAMGNYEMVASVQERREPAVPYQQLGAPGERGRLPCPFCGSDDISDGEVSTTLGAREVTQSECQNCGALGPYADTTGVPDFGDFKATAAWNRRP